MTSPVSSTAAYTREQRIRRFGVDCVDKVEWRNWTPGGEYPKTIYLRNCLNHTQVISYKLPERKSIFFMEFPLPHSLSPGMSFPLEIKFRPLDLVTYTDTIEIITEQQGSFLIHIECFVPYVDLEVDQIVEFGFCAVKETATKTITMKNIGTSDFSYTWKAEPPFSFPKASGSLQCGESEQLTVAFIPTDASGFVATAVCHVAGNLRTKIKLSGIGKYPFISLSTTEIDFGSVIAGRCIDRGLTLANRSLVSTHFSVIRAKEPGSDASRGRSLLSDDSIFTVVPDRGGIGPETTTGLKVFFRPKTAGAYYAERFRVMTPGGNEVVLKVTGGGLGVDVALSGKSLDFGDIEIGNSVEKGLTLSNHSSFPIEFQWQLCDSSGAFSVTPSNGIIPASDKLHKGYILCTVKFTPTEPVNHYRRIYCLINHHHHILYTDLLGSGVDEREKRRPAPFNQRHVDQTRGRMLRGEFFTTPEDLDSSPEAPLTTPRSASQPLPIHMWKELFTPITDVARLPFTIDVTSIDFGTISAKRAGSGKGEGRSVTIQNNTSSKAMAVWYGNEEFSVVPPIADVPAQSTATFRVVFSPATPARYYSAVVGCYVFFKIMRSFRLVDTDRNFIPPTFLPLTASGNTFTNQPHFLPSGGLSKSTISFPACQPGETLYQTVCLSNKGETPLQFQVNIVGEAAVSRRKRAGSVSSEMDELNGSKGPSNPYGCFGCFPSDGLVPAGGVQIIAFRFSPKTADQFTAMAKVRLNYSDQVLDVSLKAQSFIPGLTLTNDASVFFKPTHVGATSTRTYTVENPSKIAVSYLWEIPEKFRSVFSVEPSHGVLQGHDQLKLTLSFSPSQAKPYNFRIPCNCRSLPSVTGEDPTLTARGLGPGGGTASTRVFLNVLAEGLLGGVTMEPLALHFDTVMVGASDSKQITLYNTTGCDVNYVLDYIVDEHIPNSDDEETVNTYDPETRSGGGSSSSDQALAFSAKEGVLASRAHKVVDVIFTPTQRRPYKIVIVCRLPQLEEHKTVTATKKTKSQALDGSGSEELSNWPQCEVSGEGAFPMVQITDIRSLRLVKSELWRQFSINEINYCLQQELNEVDRDTAEFSVLRMIDRCPTFNFDFAASAVGTSPTVVFAQLTNTGRLPVRILVQSPHASDSGLDVERWWPDNVHTDDEKITEMIMDQKLFTITPMKATIPPGGNLTLRMEYQHKVVGNFSLPFLLTVYNGKRMCLRFTGHTLRPNEPNLHFISPLHDFQPCEIGDRDPPLQFVELRSMAMIPLKYTIDTAPLEEVATSNYNFPIFRCLNPTGIIAPHGLVLLAWRFTPLEAKEYCVDITVAVSESIAVASGSTVASYPLTICGKGYHPKKIEPMALQAIAQAEFRHVDARPGILIAPALPVQLSVDLLRFGRLPTHSLLRRLVVLSNESEEDAQIFEWDTMLPQHGTATLTAEPASGSIAPGSKVVCKLTLLTGSTAQIFDGDVVCRVTNATLLAAENAARQARRQDMDEFGSVSVGTASESFMGSNRSPTVNLTVTSTTNSIGSQASGKKGSGSPKKQPKPRPPVAANIPPKYRPNQPQSLTRGDLMTPNSVASGSVGGSVRGGIVVGASVTNTDVNINSQAGDETQGITLTLSLHVQFRVLSIDQYKTLTLATSAATQDVSAAAPSETVRGFFFPEMASQMQLIESPFVTPAGSSAELVKKATVGISPGPLPGKSLSSGGSGSGSDGSQFFRGVIASLVRESMHEAEVATCFERTPMDPVPFFCDFARTTKPNAVSSAAAKSMMEKREASAATLTRVGSMKVASSITSQGSKRALSRKALDSPPLAPSSDIPPNPTTDGGVDPDTLLEHLMQERDTVGKRRIMQDGAFQRLAETVLDELAADIVSDAVLGVDPLIAVGAKERLRMNRAVAAA